ncbi:hypothetical protein M0804_011526 [Polistes exclamans]|nr:hypothetical protein M0804_011526 [Polistes exclamans]
MFNFGEHRTSKRPRAIRTMKQAKQGRDIGYALVLKGCCITALEFGHPDPEIHLSMPPSSVFLVDLAKKPCWVEGKIGLP